MLYAGHSFNPGRVTVMGTPEGDSFRKMHYDIHQAINLTRMSCILEKLQEQGMPKQTALQIRAMADALVGLMTTENNRNHNY